MDSTATDSNALLASPFFWPLAAAKNWSALMNLAPQFLNQPITLGGIVNINENNSSAPETEREVLSHHSYGRQLGRIIDALSVVIDTTLPKDGLSKAQRECVDDFEKMSGEIRAIKEREALKRVDRIVRDLAFLKDKHPDEYRKVQALLARSGKG